MKNVFAHKETVVPRMVLGVTPEITRAPQVERSLKTPLRLAQLLLVLLLLCCPKFTFASPGTDPDTTKYALNDPRNPDCPCHAAQKLADEEFRKLQQQDHNPVNVVVNSDSSSHAENANDVNAQQNSNAGNVSSGVSHHVSKSTSSRKMMRKFVKRMKAHRLRKSKGTKKGNHRLASCFHFN